MTGIPDYAQSLLSAQQELKRVHTQLIDKQDMDQALVHAKSALAATTMLVLDIELRVAGFRKHPHNKATA